MGHISDIKNYFFPLNAFELSLVQDIIIEKEVKKNFVRNQHSTFRQIGLTINPMSLLVIGHSDMSISQ